MLSRIPLLFLVMYAVVSGAGAHADDRPKPQPPAAPPATTVDPKNVPVNLADWTPRPALGKAEPWEKATDKDWIDGRFRLMDTGPFLNATLRYPFVKESALLYKGTAIRVGQSSGILFDRATLQLAAAWTGGYLQHSDRRFGLLNTPTPDGKLIHAVSPGPGWNGPAGTRTSSPVPATIPLPKPWGQYRGLYLHNDRVVFHYQVQGVDVWDTCREERDAESVRLVRTLKVGPSDRTLTLQHWNGASHEIPPHSAPFTLALATQGKAQPDDVDLLLKPGLARWREPIITPLAMGDSKGPFAIDTLTIPYKNPYQALFFCTGVDFLPDGRIAVCTCHGDVWLVRVDEAQRVCHWKRYATGLYHPLGLKVVDREIVVLERGQLTRLHDRNGDDEADYYECITANWHTGAGEHSYDTCLETDPEGNFTFFKTGDTQLPHGGCLMRVSKDGERVEVLATGFRHPIGMGMSPRGIITGADQEGNWMPATRIDQYKPGGFYGDMRAHHRDAPPNRFDGPLCWLPREVDNSAGGQVWVPEDSSWPLAGLPLHLSYGRCKAFVLLRQELVDGRVQGGVYDLGLRFLSGICRGRFHPRDGHLYVCGLNGWQTAAQADGCLQRVRKTDQPLDAPVQLATEPGRIRLTFTRPVDLASATNYQNYRAACWNYHWAADYGSKRYRPSTGKEGQDDLPVTAVTVEPDGKTLRVFLEYPVPVMQLQLGFNIQARDGTPIVGSVYMTVHNER